MEKMPDGTPILCRCPFDEQVFTREHCEIFNQSHRGTLLEMVAEPACCPPTAGMLLKNKWLTAPDNILSLVTCEYDKRTRETLHLRREQEAERRLLKLSAAVLAPLENVSLVNLDLAKRIFHADPAGERLISANAPSTVALILSGLMLVVFPVRREYIFGGLIL
ncbi:MAG: hypothetical protein E7E83_06125 [Enterobacter ludwigii]|nr:hypothetical protein [Enterobacter ludwigii]